MNIALFILFGTAAGVISGMGIGGGTILILALTMLLGMNQHAAQMVNLLYFLPTATAALVLHVKNKKIEKNILLPIILPGLLTACLGAFLATVLSPDLLRKLFGAFLLCIGVIEFRKKENPPLKRQARIEAERP